MKLSHRMVAAVAAVLALAGTGHAQRIVGFKVTTIAPYGAFGYPAAGYYNPLYGGLPWYYGWPGLPVIPRPVIVPSVVTPPPVIIQNIIQPPAVAAGAGFVPPEVAPAAPPAPKPRVPAKPAIPPAMPKPEVPPPGLADADRLVEAGRRAFTDGQYGRARELFRRAVAINPKEPSTHYLISQAAFALSKYREAVAAIAAGMALRPDWPQTRYASRDLYWDNPKLYDEHLTTLRQAAAAFPNDADLVFLLAHQLWFDGLKDEAQALFRKAAAMPGGDTPAAAFLAK